MACSCAPALIVARDELDRLFPGRDKSSDGCCASAKHTQQNPKSDHEPNSQGFARAYDFDESITPGDAPLLPLKALFLKDDRCKYVIYERRIAYPDGTDKPYTGSNPHDKHLHLSIKNDAVHDTRPWGIASAFNQEDEMTKEEREEFDRLRTETANLTWLMNNSVLPALKGLVAQAPGDTTDIEKVVDEIAARLGNG